MSAPDESKEPTMLTKKLTLADATTARTNLIISAYNRARPARSPAWDELGSSQQRAAASHIVRRIRGRADAAPALGTTEALTPARQNRPECVDSLLPVGANRSSIQLMTTATTTTVTEPLHPFERAGLGKAPFRYVRLVQQDLCYGERILNRAEYEKTGIALSTKPGGTCAYCGAYIINMFEIESSDARRFHVGCDCVEKTGDAKLIRPVTVAKSVDAARKRDARKIQQKSDLDALLADEKVRTRLAARPHPKTWMAAKGATLLEWADWMMAHAGAAGRAKVLRAIRA